MLSAPTHVHARGHVLRLDVVHDDAMLCRIVSALGPHAVEAFAYTPAPALSHDVPRLRAGRHARVLVEVGGDAHQVQRVAAKLNRIVGVIEVVAASDGSG